MADVNLSLLRRRLLTWYRKNQRDLPWRRSRDPYAIWISETMLQQTQVKTVLPYYARFLDAFPTLQALAGAPLPRVLRLWSGLGYYRRAENLHKAARQIVAQHGGNLPRDYELLRALPGIGDYTAGALLSIAFDEKYPAVDGNVRRVLEPAISHQRRSGSARDRQQTGTNLATGKSQPSPDGTRRHGLYAERAALRRLSGDFALPEPRSAGTTPLDSSGQEQIFATSPGRWPSSIIAARYSCGAAKPMACWLNCGNSPAPRSRRTAKPEAAIRKELRPLAVAGLRPQRLGELRHSITDRRIHAPVLLYRWPLKKSLPPGWRWIVPSQLHRYATSSMTSKAVKLFIEHEKSPI